MDTRLLTVRNLINFFTKGDSSTLVGEYNDLFCLMLSQMVYFSDTFIRKYLKKMGCQSVRVLDYDGPTAVCVHFNGTNYFSVKGMTGRHRKDWIRVLHIVPRQFMGITAHAGFAHAAEHSLPHLQEFLAKHEGPVILTGHSMGGAIATLTSLAVDSVKVVTFGAPKSVLSDTAFTDKNINNYRINTDPVPFLPPLFYKRPGSQMLLKRAWDWNPWMGHKLFIYSTFIMPLIMEAAGRPSGLCHS